MAVIYGKASGLLLGVVSFSVNILCAQQKNNYSLIDFVDSAQHYLPLLLQKKALVNAARAGITDARHQFLPSTIIGDEVTAGTDNALPGSYFSLGLIPSSSNGIRSYNDNQSAGGNIAVLYGEYELVNFGLKGAVIRNAEANANLQQADLDREKYLLSWQISKLYFDMLRYQYQLSVDQQNVNRYDSVFKVIHAVTQSGIKPGADSSLAIAELSKARITYNQTSGKVNQLRQQLSYLTGIDKRRIIIDTSWIKNYLSAPANFISGNFIDSDNNPLIDYYIKQKTLYTARENVVRKSFQPKILLTGNTWARGSSIGYDGHYNALTDGFGYQRFNYMAGVTFAYNLFNGIRKKDKLAISRNNTIASDYEQQQQQLSIKNIGNQASEAILTAEKNLLEMPVQVKASEEGFNQKTAQYKAGIINLVDLTNASFILYRAQSDYVQTFSDWLLANLDKAAATGNLDLFIQSFKK